jgi:hypothetical protein
MKKRRAETEVFGMSFLDVISCGFGAMVMMLLLAKSSVSDEPTVDIQNLLVQKIELSKEALASKSLAGELSDAKSALAQRAEVLQTQLSKLETSNAKLNASTQKQRSTLEQAQQQLRSVTSAQSDGGVGTMKSDYVAGIPVGAEYILFIIDKSGSMDAQKAKVTSVLRALLDVHPSVKGFQIMSDDGRFLSSDSAGAWIRDSKVKRDNAFFKYQRWVTSSDSNPADGIEKALKTYAKGNISLSIYVLGDDFNGASYDQVLDVVKRYNINKVTGQPIASIHGIEFRPSAGDDRFATLMKEVAYQSNGVFVTVQ